MKGGLTSDEYRSWITFIETLHPAAKADLVGRLKSGAMGKRLRYYGKKK